MTTYLQVKFDNRKSFYNKAKIDVFFNTISLWSYDTLCAKIINGEAKVFNIQSRTTLRHVKEFLLQNGFKAESKKQIQQDYMAEL